MIRFSNMQVAGYLPQFFSEHDPRPAVEQAHTAYAHGGGWNKFDGFTMKNWSVAGGATIHYPGDPPLRECSRAKLRDETIIMFQYAWVAIVQPDGTFEIARMD